MFAPRFVEENADLMRRELQRRRSPFDLDAVLAQLGERRAALRQAETLQAARNAGSKEIGALMKAGQRAEADAKKAEMAAIGAQITAAETRVREVEEHLSAVLTHIPNLLSPEVPDGDDSDGNVEVKRWGAPRDFDFAPLDHHDLGEKLGILDFGRGGKVTGARFTVLLGAAARLSRALGQLFLDRNTERGYVEVLPPFIVNEAALRGTGQLPKFGEDLFRLQNPDHYYLVPTAEVPVTNLHAAEILDGSALPLRYTAYTPCFRAEAGSYGRDTRGLIRQHQFEKVELVRFEKPETSEAAHEEMTRHAELLLEELGLPYRRMLLCSGDTSFSAAKCYDLEVFLPGQGAYREISSCSNFKDFQARRADIRFRPEPGAKPLQVHTLNGSALPLGRTLVAILENFQRADGSVDVPEPLRRYAGFERIAAG